MKARKDIIRGKDAVTLREEKPERRKSRKPAPRRNFPAPVNNSKLSDYLGITKDKKEKSQKEDKCFCCGRDNHLTKVCVAMSKVGQTNLKGRGILPEASTREERVKRSGS